ncbi:MAG: hypothetical protein ACYC5O_03965 [Anaerolineae bacterium]
MVSLRWLTSVPTVAALLLLSACGAQPSPTAAAVTATAAAPTSVVQPSGASTTATTVAGIAPTPTSAPTVEITQVGSKTLFVLHTNDVSGYTDPCG